MKRKLMRCLMVLGGLLATGFPAHANETQLDPQLVNIAQSMNSQDYGAGLNAANTQLQHDPKNATLLRLRGICLLKENKIEDAVVALRQAVAADPPNTASKYYLAQALAEQGNILESVRLLHQVESEAPGSDYAKLAENILPQLQSLAQSTDELPPDAGTTPLPRRYSINLRLAEQYDDNVPFRAHQEDGPGRK